MIVWNRPDGKYRDTCPDCGRGERDKTMGVTIEAGDYVAHCFRCNYTESHRGQVRRHAVTPKLSQAKPARTSLSDWGMGLWGRCQPLSGVALAYLQHRRCAIPPPYGDLRWHPDVKHPSGYVGPALVALVTDANTNKPLSLHRTWITATGKADLETPRLPLAKHTLQNGVIRLWPDDEVTTGLCVAEGIETALSMAWSYAPAWSLIDAGHLAKFPVLDGIETLLIARDMDPAGIAAADKCATRWTEAGRTVLVTHQAANDINDEIQKEAA